MTTRLSTPAVHIRRAANLALETVFPPVCVRCRHLGAVLCDHCIDQLTPVSPPICDRCGRQLVGSIGPGAICADCRRHPPLLLQMRAALLYAEPADKIIHWMKYEGYFALARPLSAIMSARWPAWNKPPGLVLPIPLHPRRERQRGYNQSALLAKPLARAFGLTFEAHALRRIRHTAPQVGLGPNERADNVRDAFQADASIVRGRHVLLIDDVLTTGATMDSAARSVLAAGAESASAYCLARVS